VPFGTLVILRELGSLACRRALSLASPLACHDVGSLAYFLASFFDDELSPSQVGFELKKWFLKEF